MRGAIGLDIGTTSTIGALIAADGRTLAVESRPVTLHSTAPGWAEEDPEAWWANARAILAALATAAAAAGCRVEAIGVAGMVPALVLLDEAGAPLRRSIQQSDGRAAAEVAAMREAQDEAEFFARTGCGINQQLIAPKLRWLAAHEPAALARAATLCGSYDFITGRLTGARTVEANWALESGLMDLATRRFAPDLLAGAGIPASLLPPILAAHEIAGGLLPAIAAATGLPAGLPVVAGCADHVASAFAAGITAPGDVLLKFGGAGDILTASATPHADPRLFLDFHAIPGLFMPNGCMAASGAVLNWILRELAPSGATHAALDEAAAALPPGADGLVLLPYFLGEKTPLHDPLARGTLIGLGLHHRLAHIWRAALEGIVFGFRHHLDVMAESGIPARRFLAADGGSASTTWMQIAADAIGQPIQLLEGHSGSALGAGFIAGMGVGLFRDWGEIARFTRPGRMIRPGAARYDRPYAVFRETYDRLRTLYPRLGA
jgi:xylulokinase